MKPQISVIIPVYHVEQYLSVCLDSVLAQEGCSLEVILIDDGSTDHSGQICDQYAARDSRIKVIHQENAGAAAAKNAGLRVATGEYLSFVDSDDFLEPGAYIHMLRLLRDNDADVVQCSYRDVFRDHTVNQLLPQRTSILRAETYLALFTKDWTCALLWNKLYKRTLFDGIFFETGHKIDDEYFTYRGVMNAKRVVRNAQIVYNYRRRASSVMLSPASARQLIADRIDYLSKRRVIVIEQFPQLRPVYDSHFLNMMIILSRDANTSAENIRVIRQQLKIYFREKNHSMPEYRLLPALMRLMYGNIDRILRKCEAPQPVSDPKLFFD